MRIGIHVGSLIGGVIGSNIVRYDIYGPDVMVGSMALLEELMLVKKLKNF